MLAAFLVRGRAFTLAGRASRGLVKVTRMGQGMVRMSTATDSSGGGHDVRTSAEISPEDKAFMERIQEHQKTAARLSSAEEVSFGAHHFVRPSHRFAPL